MSDEPPKENSETPDFSKPAPSIWETFDNNRTNGFKEPAEQVKAEFSQKKVEIPKGIDLEESKRNLGEAFDRVHKHFRRKEKGDIGVYLISDNRELTISGEGGGFQTSNPGGPPLDWDPDLVNVHSDSPLGSKDQNRRMHSKSFGGHIIPQYFRTETGSIGLVTNDYSYDKKSNIWTKEEYLSRGIHAPAHIRNGRFDVNNLQTISNGQLDKMEEFHSSQPAVLPLDDNDYEQLQTILFEIERGEFERNLSKYEDEE